MEFPPQQTSAPPHPLLVVRHLSSASTPLVVVGGVTRPGAMLGGVLASYRGHHPGPDDAPEKAKLR